MKVFEAQFMSFHAKRIEISTKKLPRLAPFTERGTKCDTKISPLLDYYRRSPGCHIKCL
jgi:hypothetical protein